MRKSPPAKSGDALPSQKDTLSKGFISKTDFGKTSQNSEASKMLTVISIPYLCPEDMQTMQALAEDVILCTGDQSVSEAISANKIFTPARVAEES